MAVSFPQEEVSPSRILLTSDISFSSDSRQIESFQTDSGRTQVVAGTIRDVSNSYWLLRTVAFAFALWKHSPMGLTQARGLIVLWAPEEIWKKWHLSKTATKTTAVLGVCAPISSPIPCMSGLIRCEKHIFSPSRKRRDKRRSKRRLTPIPI